jgi:hypothetical protein
VVLGEPWLRQQQASLHYGSLEVTVGSVPSRRKTLRCASALECAGTVQDVPDPVQHCVTDDHHVGFKPVGLITAVQFRRLLRSKHLDRVFAVKVTEEGRLDTALPDMSPDMAELVREFTPDGFRDKVPAGLPPDRGLDHMIKLPNHLSDQCTD